MNDKNTNHGSKFSFNEDVSKCFSDMISRSIPNYDNLRTLIYNLIKKRCLKNNSKILDIGTSTGISIYDLAVEFKNSIFVGIDQSDEMIAKSREIFKEFNNVDISKHDLRSGIHMGTDFDVVSSVLTIQFVPIEYRLRILKDIYNSIRNEGIFIFVEKVIGNDADIDAMFIDLYYEMKINNGYSTEEIQRKKMALEGVLVPVTSKWNEELLKMSGFSRIDCFWRCLNFSGWLAIK